MIDRIRTVLGEHREVFAALEPILAAELPAVSRELCAALRAGGKAIAFGNGGSAADAQHFAAELTGRFVRERRPLPGIALTTDTSALTAIANDYGYDDVFARQVRALVRRSDFVLGISTSGNSESVCRALAAARDLGAVTVALGGNDGGRMIAWADHAIVVPSSTTARIQEAHITILHLLCEAVDQELGNDAG